MGTISKIEKLGKLHTLIKSGVNYTPHELAEKIEISTSCLYNYISELELFRANIMYDKNKKKFKYLNDFEFKIVIKSEDQQIIVGGQSKKYQIPKIWKNELYFCFDNLIINI